MWNLIVMCGRRLVVRRKCGLGSGVRRNLGSIIVKRDERVMLTMAIMRSLKSDLEKSLCIMTCIFCIKNTNYYIGFNRKKQSFWR